MTYYEKKTTVATASATQQRSWNGEAKDQTILNWLTKIGLPSANVSRYGIHKSRSVTIERFILLQDGSRA